MRVDVYTLIHKAQREHLFKLSIKMAKADFSNPLEVSKLREDLQKMIDHLRKHGESEERFVHPFYENFPDKCDLLEYQHVQLDPLFDALEALINKTHFSEELYTLFNRLIALYLQHIDEEEKLQKEILWPHFKDEDLIKIMHNFQQSLTLQQSIDNMEFMLPCLNRQEVINILAKMKNSSSEDIFQNISFIVQNAFSMEEWDQIKLGLT